MTIYRRRTTSLQKEGRGKPFSTARNAIAIDQRTGFKHPQSEMMFEPGTNYFVHRKESDGDFSIVNHPQNFTSEKFKRPERISLKHPSPDTPLFLGVVISADQLGLPSHASTFYSSTVWPSIGTGVSVSMGLGVSAGNRLDFSNTANSMYYIIIFPGI